MKIFIIFFVLVFITTSIVYSQNRLPILTLDSLLNCEYTLGPGFDKIKLKDGSYHFQVPESYASYDVWHHLHISCELNGDSLIDAIIVLDTREGGTGRWQYIFPVINNSGIPIPLKPFELSDRQNVQKIYKKKMYIYVEALVHGIDDGMCCPSIKETWKFKFQENSFIQIE